jgi:hypothetical protein
MGSRVGQQLRLAAKIILSAAFTLAISIGISRFVLDLVNRPRAFPGYTLLSPLLSTKTYLIDMQGRVVRTWESEYTAGQDAILLENGHLLRAGQLRREERLFAGFAAGGRVQEFTWDGELIWDFKFHNEKQTPHHDFAKLPNGNVLLIVWELKTAEETIAIGRRPETIQGPWLVDSVLEIRPTGKTTGQVAWEWHAWDHVIQDQDSSKVSYGVVADHPELIDINFGVDLESELFGSVRTPAEQAKKKNDMNTLRSIGYAGSAPATGTSGPLPDRTHINAVAYNAELDQIMLSVRSFSEFWIIDHSTTAAEAKGHTGGRSGKGGDLLYRWGNPQAYRAGTKADQRLFAQHDALWIPRGCPGEGHVLIFNNGLDRPGDDYSSVDEIDPPVDADGQYLLPPGAAYGPKEPVWSFTAPIKTDFSAAFMSGAQRLPNGNTLVCDGMSGTIFEVAQDRQVVWKFNYIEPARSGPDGFTPISGRTGDSSRPLELLAPSVIDALQLSPEQKKAIDEFQKEVDTGLDKVLANEQKQHLRERSGLGSGRIGGPALPGQIMSLSMQIVLKPTVEQKHALAELQKKVDAKLSEFLTEAQRVQFKELKDDFARGKSPGSLLGGPSGAGPDVPAGPPGVGDFGAPPGMNPVFRAHRYGTNFAGLAGKDLKAGKTLEELQANELERK